MKTILKVFKGQHFKKLTVLTDGTFARTKVDVQCECGTVKTVAVAGLIYGNQVSCGRCNATTHGMSKTKINAVWYNMMHRCYRVNNVYYYNYGGRGITVAEPWHDFSKFYEDMGDVPDGMQLDRIDNDGNYSLENVRWVTSIQNNRNRRNSVMIEINGVSKNLHDWAEDEDCPVAFATIYGRIKRGWDGKDAVFSPKRYN